MTAAFSKKLFIGALIVHAIVCWLFYYWTFCRHWLVTDASIAFVKNFFK